MKKYFGFSAVAFLLLLNCGCGYQIGFLNHPQLQSIAVAPVTNETLMYNGASTLRDLLCERIMTDGSMKLRSQSTADCILHARILNVKFEELSRSSKDENDDKFFPTFYSVTATLEFSVILPGRVEPLFRSVTVNGTAEFARSGDLETARLNGFKQALWDGSKKIVDQIMEGW